MTIIRLIRNEIYCFFKSHFFVCLVFFILSIFIFVYALFFNRGQESGKIPKIRIGLINEDESPYSEMLEKYISENKAILKYAVINQGTRKEIEEEFKEGQLSAYLIIPPNLIENMSELENTAIKAVISNENPVMSLVFTQVLRQYEKYIRAVEQNCQALYEKMIKDGYDSEEAWKVNEELLLKFILILMGRENIFDYEEIRDLTSVPTGEYYFYAMLSLLVLYGALLPCYNIVKSKKQGVLERNISVMSGFSYIIGMSSAGIIEGLFFFLPVFALGRIYGISSNVFGKFLLVFAVVTVILQIFTFLLLQTTNVEYIKQVISTVVVLFFFFFLAGGGLIPISYLPENFLYLSKCTPVYWLMMLFCG